MLVFPITFDELADSESLYLDLDAAAEAAEAEHTELGSESAPARTWFPETFIWTLVPIK